MKNMLVKNQQHPHIYLPHLLPPLSLSIYHSLSFPIFFLSIVISTTLSLSLFLFSKSLFLNLYSNLSFLFHLFPQLILSSSHLTLSLSFPISLSFFLSNSFFLFPNLSLVLFPSLSLSLSQSLIQPFFPSLFPFSFLPSSYPTLSFSSFFLTTTLSIIFPLISHSPSLHIYLYTLSFCASIPLFLPSYLYLSLPLAISLSVSSTLTNMHTQLTL